MRLRIAEYGLLSIAVAIAICTRFVAAWNTVFKQGTVVFTEVDPYAHMRIADNIMHNWQSITVDPYLSDTITMRPLLAWLMSVLSLGNTSMLDVVGALVPAICGVLLLVPAYFLTRKLFGKWTAVLTCLIVASLQGELLARTSLGFTDHHCLEILLSITVIWLTVNAIDNWKWAIAAGIALGLYYLNWSGAPLLLIILCAYMVIQMCIFYYRKESSLMFACNMTIIGLINLLMFKLVPEDTYQVWVYWVAAIITTVLPMGLFALSWIWKGKSIWIYVGILCMIASWITLVIWQLYPEIWTMIVRNMSMIVGTFGQGGGGSILETQPMTFQILWLNFGMIGVIGLIGTFVVIFKKVDTPQSILFVVFMIAAMLLTAMQRRFGYYIAIPIAISAAYVLIDVARLISHDKE